MERSRVVDYYSRFDEWGRLDREPLEFMINMHYIREALPATGLVLDNGAGPGKYAMELARSGYRVTLSDLTPASVDMARQKAQEMKLSQQFEGFYVLDATHLNGIDDETYVRPSGSGPFHGSILCSCAGRCAIYGAAWFRDRASDWLLQPESDAYGRTGAVLEGARRGAGAVSLPD